MALEEELADEEPLLPMTMMRSAKNRKRTAKPKVSQLTTFSDPRSFVLAKTFKPPPVIAPEAPSDLPP